MRTRSLLLIMMLILTYLTTGCDIENSENKDIDGSENYKIEPFEDIFIATKDFELTVKSDGELIEGEPMKFSSQLKYIGDSIVQFSGGDNTVILYVQDEDGNSMHNIGYTDMGREKVIVPGEIFKENFTLQGLDAGIYYLYIESCWISLDGKYHQGVGYEDLIRRKNIVTKKLIDIYRSKIVIDKYKFVIGNKM